MKKLLIIISMTALLLAGGCVSAEDNPDNGLGAATELTASIRPVSYTPPPAALNDESAVDFAFDLFGKTMANKDNNLVISPVSAYLALAMAANGAQGQTLDQFEGVLGLPINELNAFCRDLTARLTATKDSTILNIADSVWADDDMIAVDERFLQNIVDYFGAEVYSADLPSAEALAAINSWVNMKTEGLIEKLHDEPYSEDTVLVLLNTVYFKAVWAEPFDANATEDRAFNLADGSRVDSPFMNDRQSLRDYIRTEDAEGVLLPYDGGKTAFIALRPTDGTTMADFAAALSAQKLSDYIGAKQNVSMNLSLPKFEIDYFLSLNGALKNLGLSDAFDPDGADFSRLGEPAFGNIFISEVCQKVVIKVNEEGTEAAAVTEVEFGTSSAPALPAVDLVLDSPFFYAVVDLDSGIPLFMGIMDDPS